MNNVNKIIRISSEDLLNDTGIIIDLGIKTDRICIIRELKELIIFPIVDDEMNKVINSNNYSKFPIKV